MLFVDAVLKPDEKLLDQSGAGRRRQQIDRLALVQADSGPFQPFLGFRLGPENGRRFSPRFLRASTFVRSAPC
jgi:hypothetical protein